MLAALPDERISLSDRRLAGGYGMLALAATLALASWPRALVNADEYYYAGQARVLLHGRATPVDGDPLPIAQEGSRPGTRFPPGWPLALAMGGAFSFRAMFAVSLLVHLVGAIAVARLLVRRGAASWLNAIYLFHPAFWGLSRTLMSDVAAAALLLVAMDAWENRNRWLSGLVLASSCLVRVGSVFAAAGFLLAVVPRRRRGVSDFAVVASCATVGVAALAVWSRWIGGAGWDQYAAGNKALLTVRGALENALLYGAGLLLLPPFSGAWLLARPSRVDRWSLAALPTLGFFLVYAYHDASANPWLTLVGGQRLVLTAHAVLLVATAGVWPSVTIFRSRALVVAAAIAAAMSGSAVIRWLEAPHRAVAEAASRCRPSIVAYNMNAARAAVAIQSSAYRLLDGRDRLPPADVVVIAPRSLSRRPGANPASYSGPEPRGSPCVSVAGYRIYDRVGTCDLRGDPCGDPGQRVPQPPE